MRSEGFRKYRIVSPVRFFMFILIVVMSISIGLFSLLSSPSEAASVKCTYKSVTVRQNDTLWSIACEFGPDDVDVRDVIYEICEANDITANDIQPGDTIMVPVEMNY